ncbi:ACP S-malonyltransferase [Nesterenkonia cremea]|uniref:[acyl-carrier-protein] S-malonyltransferase n=1 Tax=Nesterenkonia cremea TaxID=1882340 RepID=A0A917EPG5_9MICC|nr:ACP S-malonyltransferase [Nesterenkonia cremea]GGE68471.1 ACP S-malonyltransferase [Nesterenkonia cremea]
MLAIVCPGQGSQTPGFLSTWLEQEASAERLNSYAEASGIDLKTHGTVSDEDTIRDTAVAQPLIVAASLLSAHALGVSELPADKVLFAGHSVGEVPASALAGVLSDEQALQMIAVRAAGMAEASAAAPTAMAAVVGGVEDEVRQAIADAGLTAANANGPGQIVAAGSAERIKSLEENAPARSRVIPLSVAGAFHTEYMAGAQEKLAAAVGDLQPADAAHTLLSNRDGEIVSSGQEVLDRLVDQVTRPVRWDLCMEAMKAQGVTGILELLPGGTLTGLAKRGFKGVKSFAVKAPEDLDAAREFIAEHTHAAVSEDS